MKATLEFNLPEDKQENMDSLEGTACKLVAWRMHESLFKSHHDGVKTLKTLVVLKTLNDILEELGLDLDR
jgi:hypothetical protein